MISLISNDDEMRFRLLRTIETELLSEFRLSPEDFPTRSGGNWVVLS